jgi:hypothetical protein
MFLTRELPVMELLQARPHHVGHLFGLAGHINGSVLKDCGA